MKIMQAYRFWGVFLFVSSICLVQQAHNSPSVEQPIDQKQTGTQLIRVTAQEFIQKAKSFGYQDQEIIQTLERSQQKELLNNLVAQEKSAQSMISVVAHFIQQAQSLGYSDQEIRDFIDQARQKELTSETTGDFFAQVLAAKQESQVSLLSDYLMYTGLAGAGILSIWLLYELYTMLFGPATHEVSLRTYPEDAISQERLKAAEALMLKALQEDEDPKKIVHDLAKEFSDEFEDENVYVKAHWNNRGAHHNMSVEV